MLKPQLMLTYEQYLNEQGTREEIEYYEFLVVSNYLIHNQYDGTGPEYRDAAQMLWDWAQRLPQETEAQQAFRRQKLAMAKALNSQTAVVTVVSWLLKKQFENEKFSTQSAPLTRFEAEGVTRA